MQLDRPTLLSQVLQGKLQEGDQFRADPVKVSTMYPFAEYPVSSEVRFDVGSTIELLKLSTVTVTLD